MGLRLGKRRVGSHIPIELSLVSALQKNAFILLSRQVSIFPPLPMVGAPLKEDSLRQLDKTLEKRPHAAAVPILRGNTKKKGLGKTPIEKDLVQAQKMTG